MKRRMVIALIATVLVLSLGIVLLQAWRSSAGVEKFSVGKALPPGNVKPQLGVGTDYAILLAPDGSLWTWGHFRYGFFGASNISEVPRRIGKDNDWRKISAGPGTTLALKADGSLWDLNVLGSLGVPVVAGRLPPPKRIGRDTNWTAISAGNGFYMALKRDGSLWSWGQNNSGVANNTYQIAPLQIGDDHYWKSVAAGTFAGYALKQDGTLWKLGQTAILGKWNSEPNPYAPARVAGGMHWLAISASDSQILALRYDGSLWIGGQNGIMLPTGSSGYLPGDATLNRLGSENDWTEVYSGSDCIFACKRDGTWWVYGDNTSRKLGVGPIVDQSQPQPSQANQVIVSSGNGQTYTVLLNSPNVSGGTVVIGSGTFSGGGASYRTIQPPYVDPLQKLPLNLDPWAFATGGSTTLALTRDGYLWTWGTRLGVQKSPLAANGIRGLYDKTLAWCRSLFQKKTNTQQLQVGFGTLSGGTITLYNGMPATAVIDNHPHKLWRLPYEVRRSLGKNSPDSSNSR